MSPTIRNQVKLAGVALAAAVALTMSAGVAFAQSGHFSRQDVDMHRQGTQVECSGKVAGLGGTTFEIRIHGKWHWERRMHEPGRERRAGSGHRSQRGGDHWAPETPRNGNFHVRYRD